MRPVAEKPRYLTYQCRFCAKQERRYRIIAHVLKDHVPLDRVPFYCSWCNFRSLNKESLVAHLNGYPNHKDEVARRGVPDYRKVLKKSANPIRIEDLMFPIGKATISSSSQGNTVFADKEDEVMMSGAIQLPEWLSEADMPEPPSVSRQILPEPVPEYVPTPRELSSMLSMPTIGFDALLDDANLYEPHAVIHSGLPRRSTWAQPSVTAPTATTASPLFTLPAGLTSQTRQTTPHNKVVLPVQKTPHSAGRQQRLVATSTPLMDEILGELGVLPTTTDEMDPLLREEDRFASRKRPAETSPAPPKRQCIAIETEEACKSLIADAVSKGTAMICEALGEQLKVMQTMQAAMAKQLEESARMERRSTAILRLLEDKLNQQPQTRERGKSSPVKRIKSVVTKK